jgi:LytR cell envelope-related transcriptional attenuator
VKLGSGRLVVMVALVAGGIILLATGFSGSPGVAAASGTHSPSPSPTGTHHTPPPTSTPAPHTTGVAIAVFNATSTANLATKGQKTLVNAGYVPAQTPQNSPIKSAVTVIYYRPGAKAAQNRSDAQYISNKYFPGAAVSELGSAFIHLAKGADVVVVLGDDYAQTGK